jgi:hypothetical protein
MLFPSNSREFLWYWNLFTLVAFYSPSCLMVYSLCDDGLFTYLAWFFCIDHLECAFHCFLTVIRNVLFSFGSFNVHTTFVSLCIQDM